MSKCEDCLKGRGVHREDIEDTEKAEDIEEPERKTIWTPT
jgi:hypothetical protein